ncbi:helix-turn-helix domain-containing protein [Tardiphaga robiniae]|uniref:ImmA/IrrE family metallo-endopeptidase n=1 Tax=Tardiphaga robiniae TaxID=943830 RepID=A0A7G6TYW2_9BRAD|nr:XRE family transcriptional regulator [Tardiphaga robiniae]QND71944.1 ImmA/IrrE family metallo-endopeptidase [Tardiphaga robiniae]
MSRFTTREYFVKERLTEARDARGLTQTALAAAMKRSGSTISNWERGEQAPEPATLNQLAQTLGVSTNYLLCPMPQHGDGAIFFRSLANASIRARTKEKARMRWLQHISLSLQETLEFPEVNIPEFVTQGAYLNLKEEDLERTAENMRLFWKLGEGPINNAVLVVENAGVVVGIDEIGSTKIDGQANWSNQDSRPYILLARDKYTAFRRQMDIAHELAHLILHKGVSEEELAENFDLIEHQAKYLACAFLLPHRTFASELFSLSLDGFLALKSRWKVSIGAMIMRAHHLDLINDEATQRLWKYRATRGWHRREPLDSPSETPVEEPRLLRRSIELIVSEQVRSKSELMQADFGLAANDIEMLASLPIGYFSETADVVAFEPRIRIVNSNGQTASIVPLRRPN